MRPVAGDRPTVRELSFTLFFKDSGDVHASPGDGLTMPVNNVAFRDGWLVSRVLRDELLGADALRREWLWHRLWELNRTEELPLYLLGLVDTALWDLAGRVAGMPTWQLLGGFRTAIPTYASTVTFTTLEE